MKPHSAQDRLLDVREAATLLAVKPKTLYQWAHLRRIPTVKLLGGCLRFRLSDLEAVIQAGSRPPLEPGGPSRRGGRGIVADGSS